MLAAVHAAVHIPKGKVVVLTGSTGAIGQAIAAGVAGSNIIAPTVGLLILIVRNAASRARADRLAKPLRGKALRVDVVVADLAQPAAVAECAAQICAACSRVDVLIHCAAEVPPAREEVDGLERQFSTNALSAFILMKGLRPSMPSGARVVLLADLKLAEGLEVSDLQSSRIGYEPSQAYARTKQALRMLAAEAACGHGFDDLLVTCCHPGVVQSDLASALGLASHATTDSTATAAKTPLFLALGPACKSGTFWGGNKQQLKDTLAEDADGRRALWEACEGLAAAACGQQQAAASE